jgi:UDP-glucose 4-epimerase
VPSRRRVVALTGATSFSGIWIAQALVENGWSVFAQCSRKSTEYKGLREIRYQVLAESGVEIADNLNVERGDFIPWIKKVKPTVWIHHHHFMEHFRSPQYDLNRAKSVGLDTLRGIVGALKEVNCEGIIASGTYFEPGEGHQPQGAQATPYAQSKFEIWNSLRALCGTELQLSKLVFPNPVGPFENADRLIPQMLRAAKKKEAFKLGSPESIADQVSILDIAQEYVTLADEMMQGKSRIARPSGYKKPLREWVKKVSDELLESRLGLSGLKLEFGSNPSSVFINSNVTDTKAQNWDQTWDHYAKWLSRFPLALESE